MATKSLTAPLAIIKVNGIAVGKMKTVRLTETIRRGRVVGIGNMTPDELPALDWSGTLNCSQYNIEFKDLLNGGANKAAAAILRQVNTVEEFVNTILLREDGFTLDVMKKIASGPADPVTGVIPGTLEVFASIKGMFITRESMDISEGQISGRDADFEYITPVIFPL